MANYEAQNYIVTNGLVLNLDAGDPDSYTRSQPPYVEVLVVAGGGGGSGNPVNNYRSAGGGGGGGVIYNSAYQLTNAAAITVTVGSGGAGSQDTGTNGSNSVFGSLTAIGGGRGGSTTHGTTVNGADGGSGGGGGDYNGDGGNGTIGQGFRGGNSRQAAGIGAGASGGGGGGAGGPGEDCINSYSQISGGPSITYSISGTSTAYAAGGASLSAANTGNPAGASGGANTGTGGQGARYNVGGNGGSGIVIVRYPGLPAATGGTIAYLNGYTIHTFTTSGTFTPFLWNDVSGNGNNGTLNNGTAFVPNIQGGYFNFDGTDDNVTIPASSIPSSATTNNVSICFWSFGVAEDNASSIIEARDSGGSRTVNIHLPWSNNVIYWDVAGSAYDRITYSLAAGQSLGWNFWSFTRNSSTGVMAIYQNGAILTSGGGYFTTINVTTSAKIGSYTVNTNFFIGRIGVAQIYNRALSAAEITQNYNATKARFGL
jgi:hypothetical protein